MKLKFIVVALLAFALPLFAFASTGTIDSTNKYAWGSNTGFVNFNPTNGNVQVTDSALTGYAWSDTYGWINLAPSNAGVTNDGSGNLSGYAWGEKTGYISFSGVTINTSSGQFSGQATGTIIGTLTFNCANCGVVTTWRPTVLSGISYGNSSYVVGYGPPAASPAPATADLSASTLAFTPPNSLRLVVQKPTYYLIQNGKIQGITSPGILASYGFAFKDGVQATAADLELPHGNLLLPDDGALVKSQQDKTVYLVSDGQRYAFVSSKIFTALGFKFSSVLLVTNPELQALPEASIIASGSGAHLDGLNISRSGTVYWIISGVLHPYPSLAVYNSWNIDNDFSRVVAADTEDLQLPVGGPVTPRTLNQ